MDKKQKTAQRMSWCDAFEYLHCTGRELWGIIAENGLPVYSQDGIYRYYHPSQFTKENICTNPHIFIWAIDFNPATELIEPISLEPNIPCNPMDEPSMPFPSDAGCDRYSFPETERIILENKFGEMWINLTDGFCCFIRQPLITKKYCDAWFRRLTGKDCTHATHIPTSEPGGICFGAYCYTDENGELIYGHPYFTEFVCTDKNGKQQHAFYGKDEYTKLIEYQIVNDNISNYSKKIAEEANELIEPLLPINVSEILTFTYRLRPIQKSNTDNDETKKIEIRIDSYQKYIYKDYIAVPFPYRKEDGLSMQFRTYPMGEGVRVPSAEALKHVTQSENINPRKFVSKYVNFQERLAIFDQANEIENDMVDLYLMEEHCEEGYEDKCLPADFSIIPGSNLTNDFFFKTADLKEIREQREQEKENTARNKIFGTEELQNLSTDDLKKLVILEKILTDLASLTTSKQIKLDLIAFKLSLRYAPMHAIAEKIYWDMGHKESYISRRIKDLPSRIEKLYEELEIPTPPKNYSGYQREPYFNFWNQIEEEDLMELKSKVDEIKKNAMSSSETKPTEP